MSQKLLIALLLLILTGLAYGQATNAKSAEDAAKLEKDAIEFLRETSVDVGTLRTMENRISFNAELASLMWFHDEKEAKAMYGGVVADFKQLLAQFDSEMNTQEMPNADDMDSAGGLFGGFGKSKVERKFRIAMAVRQQIAMSLAEHAPDLAYNFFYDSRSQITNAKFRKDAEEMDKTFEFQLMKQIADSNAAQAAEYGKESIKAGLNANHIELLKKIYSKDEDKGIEFGAAILSQMKTDKSNIKDMYFYSSLLRFGASNFEASKKPGGKKAVYSAGDLRDIADQFGQAVLDRSSGADDDSDEDMMYSGVEFASQIEKYAPARAAQIRAKFRKKNVGNSSANSVKTMTLSTGSGLSNSNMATASSSPVDQAQRDREERAKTEKKMMEDVASLGSKPLPKEERDKIVAQARKIIAETPGKEKKIVALSLLAAQVAKAGDKELAAEIMRDAERMVNPQPKNYQDFLLSWMLASGYAEADPEKAFPLLETTILRANDMIAAFVKVAEFIDVNDELVTDGEFQVGMFGGTMIRGLTNELGMASGTIRSLAKADFAKTKNLTNTFDRTEIRVLAKMMVLRAVLDKRASTGLTEKVKDEDSPDLSDNNL